MTSVVQLPLPTEGISHPRISPAQAKAALEAAYEGCEVWGEPFWDWVRDEWVAVVAINFAGPLVRMAFQLKEESVRK